MGSPEFRYNEHDPQSPSLKTVKHRSGDGIVTVSKTLAIGKYSPFGDAEQDPSILVTVLEGRALDEPQVYPLDQRTLGFSVDVVEYVQNTNIPTTGKYEPILMRRTSIFKGKRVAVINALEVAEETLYERLRDEHAIKEIEANYETQTAPDPLSHPESESPHTSVINFVGTGGDIVSKDISGSEEDQDEPDDRQDPGETR